MAVRAEHDRSRLWIPLVPAGLWCAFVMLVAYRTGMPLWGAALAGLVQGLIVYALLEGLAVKDEVLQARNRRNVSVALALFVMVNVFFAVTIVRLGGNVAKRMQNEAELDSRTRVIEPAAGTGDSQ